MSQSADRPEVVAIYCPLWHSYDHASSWKGECWCEWELLRSAKPRFEGHYQPYKPIWGCFDESDPSWSAREIALAASSGIDVFLVDWYWYSGVRIMEEALERGLLKARNAGKVKFALMWANHHWADYFPAPFGQKWDSWLPSRHTPVDWERVIDYCIEHYFRRPNYWRACAGLFFSLFEPLRLVRELGGAKQFKSLLAKTNRRLGRAKLPPLHLNAMLWGPEAVDELKAAGFASTTRYNVTSSGKAGSALLDRYEDVMEAHRGIWEQMAAASLPHLPVVTMGWDVTPRCEATVPWPFPPSPATDRHDYPYTPIIVGNTPELFGRLCCDAAEHCRKTRPQPNAIMVNAWNEWTEGSFLLPEERYKDGYLKALAAAVGGCPSQELRPA